jgi:hypothetical protein
MPNFVTVFQISSGSPGFPFALAGLVPLIIGAVFIVGKWRLGWRKPGWLLPGFFIAFGIMWIFLVSGPVLTEDTDAFAAFRAGQYSSLEGTVTEFHAMPYEGHDDECFTVKSQRFCYSDYEVTPGFHNAALHGGPIRAGIHVRIAYLGSTILRLQIRQDEVPTPAELTSTTESAQRQYIAMTENDPTLQRLTTAFLLTALCWVLWWNLQWRLVMRIWARPPNKQVTVYFYRVFFALNLIGCVGELVRQLRNHPLTGQNLGSTLLTAAIMCGVVGTMTALSVWIAARRGRGTNSQGI